MKLAVLALLLLAGCAEPRPAASATCVTGTAVTGSETGSQHNTGTLTQIVTAQPVTFTHLTISVSYTQRTGPATGLSELLVLVGISDGPLTVLHGWIPVTPVDPAFTGQTVTTQGNGPHNENPSLYNGVVAARVLKSYNGSASDVIDIDVDQAVPAGGVLWIRYGSRSVYPLDPEVQTVATYMRCGG